jgi:hypothetical protein
VGGVARSAARGRGAARCLRGAMRGQRAAQRLARGARCGCDRRTFDGVSGLLSAVTIGPSGRRSDDESARGRPTLLPPLVSPTRARFKAAGGPRPDASPAPADSELMERSRVCLKIAKRVDKLYG